MTEFHDYETGDIVPIDPKQVQGWGHHWGPHGHEIGTRVKLADETILHLREPFAEFHHWLYPPKPKPAT